ncbi:hypothetical protein HF072_08025 [Bacillus sp. RO3]|nr:hypothetical protein [Bacillus sp. RO3]
MFEEVAEGDQYDPDSCFPSVGACVNGKGQNQKGILAFWLFYIIRQQW